MITGGGGADVIKGGGGADQFIFGSVGHSKPGSKADVIKDFKASQDDIIVLKAIDAQTGSGNQAFDFIGSAGFSGTKGELRYQDVGSDLRVQADTNGDGNADFEIVLRNISTLSADDFIL